MGGRVSEQPLKASELRIGNWIIGRGFSGLATQKVSGATVYGIMAFNEEGYLKDVAPIPLTPEILEKAGFKEYIDMGNKTGMWDHPTIRFSYSLNNRRVMIMHPGNNTSHWLNVNVQHLHQLQNLYFALTGEELEINLT